MRISARTLSLLLLVPRVALEWLSRSVVVDLPARSITTARWPAN